MTARSQLLDADLHAYVDGQLSGRDLTVVSRYLTDDAEAAARAARWTMQRDALRARLAPVADEALPLRLKISRMKAAAEREERGKFLFVFGFLAGFGFGIAIAGAMLMKI